MLDQRLREASTKSAGSDAHRDGNAAPITAGFRSLLDAEPNCRADAESRGAPDFFVDLNLDQIIDAVIAGKEEYDLKPLFWVSLTDVDAVEYRHEVMRDLESDRLLEAVTGFAQKMRDMRAHIARAQKFYYRVQKDAWFLDAVEIYVGAVDLLAAALAKLPLKSRGFAAFREYLARYANSGKLSALREQTKNIKADLSALAYCVRIKGDTLKVSRYGGEADYSAEVLSTFEKFKEGAVVDDRAQFANGVEMNHIEAKIVEFVAQLYPAEFMALEKFCAAHVDYLDSTVRRFDREVQYYVSYLEFIAKFKPTGLNFCYPVVSNNDKEVYAEDVFDLALAHKLLAAKTPVVCNDFCLNGKERIFVVSGPNQGGKTTFARTFGQLHFLASLGLPVPGTRARLYLFDRLFTHFEKEEDIRTLRGKLEDDLVRIRAILASATPKSILIMNEIFTSTTLHDAVFLSTKVMEKVVALDLLCVWVTFVDELAGFGVQAVSMVSTVDSDNAAERTYKILRRPADGLAYALAIAEKYRLSYQGLKERLRQ